MTIVVFATKHIMKVKTGYAVISVLSGTTEAVLSLTMKMNGNKCVIRSGNLLIGLNKGYFCGESEGVTKCRPGSMCLISVLSCMIQSLV